MRRFHAKFSDRLICFCLVQILLLILRLFIGIHYFLFPQKSSENLWFCHDLRRIEVNEFSYICLILAEKSGDDPFTTTIMKFKAVSEK